MPENNTVKFGRFVISHPWLVILASILLVVATTYGARFLEIKTDYRVFFAEDNPQLIAFENIQNTYDKADNAMFVITPKEGSVFDRETLKSIHWLTEQAWQIPYTTRVDSITNYQHTWVTPEDEDYMLVGALLCIPDKSSNFDSECEHESVSEQMIDDLSDAEIKRLQDIVLHEPQLVNRVINPDSSVTAVNVTVQQIGRAHV